MGRKPLENYKKRRTCFGLSFILLVGVIIFFSLNNFAISGCAGDCMTCHPKLIGSNDHISLTTCVSCHDPAKPKLTLYNANDGCGDRCFLCHNEWPKDGSHADLNKCLECHER